MKTVGIIVAIVVAAVIVGYQISQPNEVTVNVRFSDEPIYIVPEYTSSFRVPPEAVSPIVGGFRDVPERNVAPRPDPKPDMFRPLDYK